MLSSYSGLGARPQKEFQRNWRALHQGGRMLRPPRLQVKRSVAVIDGLSKSGEVLLECRNVKKAFGTKTVLDDISFKIYQGEAVGIIGPSGTGKSTVLKILSGILAPDQGEVIVRGTPRNGLVMDNPQELSKLKVGMVFQSGALFDSLTVGENVGFLLYEHTKLSHNHVEQRVAEALKSVGLSGIEKKYPSELSGGMKKRVALARAIIQDSPVAQSTFGQSEDDNVAEEVVMYDEPTAGLDPVASTVVEDLIRSMHRQNGGQVSSYIVVTHQHSTIRRAVDRLIFLFDGKVAWEGTPLEFEESSMPLVKQFATGSLNGPIVYL